MAVAGGKSGGGFWRSPAEPQLLTETAVHTAVATVLETKQHVLPRCPQYWVIVLSH